MRAIAAVTVPAVVGLTLIGGAAQASAADHHHPTKAERAQRQAARVEARRAERRADKPATKPTPAPKPATGGTVPGRSHQAPGGPIHGTPAPCAVTSGKPVRTADGAQALITNTCPGNRVVVVTVQAQAPGPWHPGICQETGACHQLGRFLITVTPGQHYVAAEFTACRVQVDVSLPGGKLLRAAQFGESGCKVTPPTPKPKPPVVHNPKPVVHQQPKPHARVRVPATSVELTALPRTGGVEVTEPVGLALLGILAGGLLVGLTRRPARQTAAARAALKAGEGK